VPVWTGAENLAPAGIRSPDRPVINESLYRLSYPGSSSDIICYFIARPHSDSECIFGHATFQAWCRPMALSFPSHEDNTRAECVLLVKTSRCENLKGNWTMEMNKSYYPTFPVTFGYRDVRCHFAGFYRWLFLLSMN